MKILMMCTLLVNVKDIRGAVSGGVSKFNLMTPDAFWSFSQSTVVSSSAMGYMGNVSYTSDYIYGNKDDRAVYFSGKVNSYMALPNVGKTLNATSIGAWFFHINPDTDATEGTILEYEGKCPGGNGFAIRYHYGSFKVQYTSSSGEVVESAHSSLSITPGLWSYVGVSWHNVYPQIFLLLNGELEVIHLHNFNRGETFQAQGYIKIGSPFDLTMTAFKGRLACLWFQEGYYTKKNKTPIQFCNPDLRTASFLKDTTMPAPPTFLPTSCAERNANPVSTEITPSCAKYTPDFPTNGVTLDIVQVKDIFDCFSRCRQTAGCLSILSNATGVAQGTCILGKPDDVNKYDSSYQFYNI